MRDFLLLKCTLISVALHTVTMALFFTHPLHFNVNFFTSLGKTAPTVLQGDEIAMLKKDKALEEAFQYFFESSLDGIPSSESHPALLEERSIVVSGLALPKDQERKSLPSLPLHPLSTASDKQEEKFIPSSLCLAASPTIQVQGIEGPIVPSFSLSSASDEVAILDFEFFPSHENPSYSLPGEITVGTPLQNDISILAQEYTPDSEAPSFEKLQKNPPLSLKLPRRISLQSLPALSDYGIPAIPTLEWNDIFDIDVKTAAREEGGYLFSLTFQPKIDLSRYRLKQNYYFLIDRSNSIEKHRYQTFKRAVLRALASLREGDLFNIIIFDSKIAKLSESLTSYNKKSHLAAEEFLEKQPHGHYGAATDIYTSLDKILPAQVNEDEAHTAILISDGDSKLKPEKQRQLIQSWLESNKGKITLYTAAVGQGNNLSILDLLGTVGRGALLYSDTHTGFPRKLAKLILTVRSPIAKELSFTLSSSNIQIYPSPHSLPYLFSDHPFVLYGTADQLTDFSITLQGKHEGDVLYLQKNVSFAKAKPGNRFLLKEWASQQGHHYYEQYLKLGEPVLLEKAQALLSHEPAYSQR